MKRGRSTKRQATFSAGDFEGQARLRVRLDGSNSRQAAPDPTVTRALVAAGADVLSIAPSRHTLEDVCLELVGDAGKRSR
jgi:hypothetical protein